MKKLAAVFLLLLAIAFLGTLTKSNSPTLASLKKLIFSPHITIKNQTFSLLVAKTEAEREKGLSGRASLPKNQAMYFVFDHPDYYAFWMKDMEFPLDIIYIHNNTVVTIYQNLQAPKKDATTWQIIKPSEPADGVLEINAGLASQYQIQKGDSVNLSL